MQRIVPGLALATLVLPAAQAQQLSMFGVADVAVRQVANSGSDSTRSLSSGANATSRIGLRGTEDLGGGLSAGFHLEHGLLLETGTPASSSKFWDRRATISLSSSRLGEWRMGRDYVPTYSAWTRYDVFSYVGAGRSADFFSGSPGGPVKLAFGSFDNPLVRTDRSLQYLLPGGLGGLEGGVMLSAGEDGAASAGQVSHRALRLGYGGSGFSLSAATGSSSNDQTVQGRFRDTTVGGDVQLGPARLTAAWRRLGYADARQTVLMLGGVGSFGPHQVKAAWMRADFAGTVAGASIDANDARKWALGYQYNLSRRSAVYATVAHLGNQGTARLAIPGGGAAPLAGGSSRALEAGVRHSF